MKREKVSFVLLLLMVAQQNYVISGELHINSFGAAVSTLQSEVHAGLVEILSHSRQPEVDINSLIERAESLKGEVCSRLGNSPGDTIQSDDKAYLQQMIDKIDSIIAALEGIDAKKSIEFQESCTQLKESLDN